MTIKATIVASGAQKRVKQGDILDVDRVAADPGSQITYEQVLLVEDGEQVTIGTPTVANATVSAEVLGHHRGKKVKVFKMRRRKDYRRTRGHRSDLSKIRITGIEVGN